ncbi:MAG: TonB-dependent receptor [Cyclobacteriaceae bacterium]
MILLLRFSVKLLFLILIISQSVHAQSGGTVKGVVTDDMTGEFLPGATISIKGTTQGVVTDIYGNFSLYMSAGQQVIEIRYIGYGVVEKEVMVEAGKLVEINVAMELDSFMGQEIVITGQAVGQAAAINQQINANTIVNVVSQDKIRELPDQNAAETVGRLPGIAIQRDAGEGQKVIVRGLSPRFNSITINGERIPSTSSDRSVDLSMMSPDVLAGIEVFKSLTPDKDADAVGGTINFLTKRADSDPEAQMWFQYGYNGLHEEWGQIRGSLSAGKRFFNDRFGAIASGNFQKANRNVDQISNSYSVGQELGGVRQTIPEGVSMRQDFEDRYRYGGSLVLDYQFNSSNVITLNTLVQFTQRDRDRHRSQYNGGNGTVGYRQDHIESLTSLFSNNISGEHTLGNAWKLTWRGSVSSTSQDTPINHQMNFIDRGGAEAEATPEAIFDRAMELHDLNNTLLQNVTNQVGDNRSLNWTGQVDLEIPVNLTNSINGFLKFGGKVRQDTRERDETSFQILGMESSSAGYLTAGWLPDGSYERNGNGNINLYSFLAPFDDRGYKVSDIPFRVGTGDTLQGQHLSGERAMGFYNNFNQEYTQNNQADFDDYSALDRITSGYAMGTFNLTKTVTVVGGLRAENTFLRYRGVVGSSQDLDQNEGLTQSDDTLRTRSYFELFPQVNMKIQPVSWFDIRLAATKTINRPNFQSLVPWSRLDQFNKRLTQGNFDLQHMIAWNYDAFFSFYNRLGLLTVGGFYKELTNIDFSRDSRFTNEFGTVLLRTRPDNTQSTATVQGVEIDLQMNFRFLPSPFDGILLSANATFIETNTFYPFLEVLRNPTRELESEREAPMIGQPNSIYNLSLGYERGGFTGRISFMHQGTVVADINDRSDTDTYTQSFERVDLTFKQRVSEKLRVYMNFNNITNQQDVNLLQGLETSVSMFGPTADFGLQFQLK